MRSAAILLTGLLLTQSGGAQQRTTRDAGSDWPMYRHDQAGTGYSPLAEINTTNVARPDPGLDLSPAGRRAAPPRGRWQRRRASAASTRRSTPIVVNGVMYLPAANRVVALEPETGQGNLELPGHRRRAVAPRGGLLARRRQPRATHHLRRRAAA